MPPQKPTQKFLKSSKKIHRILGLLGLLYFAVMALSGILLNHPALLTDYDLPRALLPGDYQYRQWNRNSFRSLTKTSAGRFIHGEGGVWKLTGEGAPADFNEGLPKSVYLKDTRALTESGGLLWAATRGGLFYRGDDSAAWRPVKLGKEGEGVVDLVRYDDSLIALTRSDIYFSSASRPFEFRSVTPKREGEEEPKRSLFMLIFELHSGELWGLGGRLFIDLIGALLLFITFTGGWFWWRRWRGSLSSGSGGKLARKGLKLHIKLGVYLTPLLLYIALTGIFQRPPLLIAIADATYELKHHPAPLDPNPWHDTIRKGLYDSSRRTLLLATSEGFYEGGVDNLVKGDETFLKLREPTPPVSVMGATVLEELEEGHLVGSMSGLFLWGRSSGTIVDLFTKKQPEAPKGPPVGKEMVVGFSREGGLWADYNRGLMRGWGRPVDIPMPRALSEEGRISLWHALFELHNGRLFTFILGWWAWIVIPLGGIALLTETATGFYDRVGYKLFKGK